VMPVQQANYADVVGANEKDMKNFVLWIDKLIATWSELV
jgi:hypothetical protein